MHAPARNYFEELPPHGEFRDCPSIDEPLLFPGAIVLIWLFQRQSPSVGGNAPSPIPGLGVDIVAAGSMGTLSPADGTPRYRNQVFHPADPSVSRAARISLE